MKWIVMHREVKHKFKKFQEAWKFYLLLHKLNPGDEISIIRETKSMIKEIVDKVEGADK